MDRRQFLSGGAALLGAAALGASLGSGLVQARALAKTTGWVWDDIFLTPVFSPTHPEQPERVSTILQTMDARGVLAQLEPISIRQPTDDELRLIHTPEHIAGIRRNHGAQIDALARAAVGGTLAACEAVHAGKIRNAFVCSRPPGHHARNDGREEGFCFYNHVAIAARFVQQVLGYRRVLIVDWDYHHGDGTEYFFYRDPDVLFFSTHDWGAYPRTGDPGRTGADTGIGTNINVPLRCGATDADMLQAFDTELLPAALAFDPDFVLISAGFDSRMQDLLGCFAVTDEGYRQMTERVCDIAKAHCDGRVVSVLEGGYNFAGIASGVATHVATMAAYS